MITGIGMPRTQSKMPRMMNLDPLETIEVTYTAMRGGSMAKLITDEFLHRRTNARGE
jgi:hypothetical protein